MDVVILVVLFFRYTGVSSKPRNSEVQYFLILKSKATLISPVSVLLSSEIFFELIKAME